jgi:hypothetical protein
MTQERPSSPPSRPIGQPARGRPRTRTRKPSHGEIAERAYFIHLEDGDSDQLANWLRAEREHAAA